MEDRAWATGFDEGSRAADTELQYSEELLLHERLCQLAGSRGRPSGHRK